MKTIFVKVGFKDHKLFKELCHKNEVFMSDIIRDFIKKLVEDFKDKELE